MVEKKKSILAGDFHECVSDSRWLWWCADVVVFWGYGVVSLTSTRTSHCAGARERLYDVFQVQ